MLTHLSHLRPLSAVNHGAVVDGEGVLPYQRRGILHNGHENVELTRPVVAALEPVPLVSIHHLVALLHPGK